MGGPEIVRPPSATEWLHGMGVSRLPLRVAPDTAPLRVERHFPTRLARFGHKARLRWVFVLAM
jgi:hypothetical protein